MRLYTDLRVTQQLSNSHFNKLVATRICQKKTSNYIEIYLEPKWPLFWLDKDLVLEGSTSKIGDKQVPGIYNLKHVFTNPLFDSLGKTHKLRKKVTTKTRWHCFTAQLQPSQKAATSRLLRRRWWRSWRKPRKVGNDVTATLGGNTWAFAMAKQATYGCSTENSA